MHSFFTSDWHLYHRRIFTYSRRLEFMNEGERKNLFQIEARGNERCSCGSGELFKGCCQREALRQLRYSDETINKFHSWIADHANATVGQDDEIWHLGDIIFGDLEQLRRLRQRIICRNIHLIFGNHDKDIMKAWSAGDLRDVFKSAQHVARINVEGQGLWLSHYAHITWDKSHYGVWHLYGHSHGSLEQWIGVHLPEAKMLDVGIDYRAQLGKGYTFWNFPELKKYMAAKGGEVVDHHAGRTNHDDE